MYIYFKIPKIYVKIIKIQKISKNPKTLINFKAKFIMKKSDKSKFKKSKNNELKIIFWWIQLFSNKKRRFFMLDHWLYLPSQDLIQQLFIFGNLHINSIDVLLLIVNVKLQITDCRL